MKLNEIFGVRSMKESFGRGNSYVPPLIREFAGEPEPEEDPGLKGDEWNMLHDPNRLVRQFDFDDASIMRRFVTEVLSFQEDANHHGSLLIENDSIRVEVWTHDVNDVTELDREYAAELSDIYGDVMGTYSNVG